MRRSMLHIGLKYAEEIGEEGDPNPRYFCHMCKLYMDCNNVGLHFTSTAHRYTVLVREHCMVGRVWGEIWQQIL